MIVFVYEVKKIVSKRTKLAKKVFFGTLKYIIISINISYIQYD